MRPLFSIFVLVIAGALAFGTGCAEDLDFPGAGGSKGGGNKTEPSPSASPSGTGGKVIND